MTVETTSIVDSNAGAGGGINNDHDGVLAISNSTLNGNQAREYGGALYNRSQLVVVNSTFSGNLSHNLAEAYFRTMTMAAV